MAVQNNSSIFLSKLAAPAVFPLASVKIKMGRGDDKKWRRKVGNVNNSSDGNKKKGVGVPNSNYVVPLDHTLSSCITRPLAEILRDLNKRIPDNVIKSPHNSHDDPIIPWYHANRMLSFYAPGWCGEIRDVIFSDNGSVTVVYRVTIRGSDGEVYFFSF